MHKPIPQDLNAYKEGLRFVAFRGGKRIAYASTAAEALTRGDSVFALVAHMDRAGRLFVTLVAANWQTRNPSSGSKQRTRGTRIEVAQDWVDGKKFVAKGALAARAERSAHVARDRFGDMLARSRQPVDTNWGTFLGPGARKHEAELRADHAKYLADARANRPQLPNPHHRTITLQVGGGRKAVIKFMVWPLYGVGYGWEIPNTNGLCTELWQTPRDAMEDLRDAMREDAEATGDVWDTAQVEAAIAKEPARNPSSGAKQRTRGTRTAQERKAWLGHITPNEDHNAKLELAGDFRRMVKRHPANREQYTTWHKQWMQEARELRPQLQNPSEAWTYGVERRVDRHDPWRPIGGKYPTELDARNFAITVEGQVRLCRWRGDQWEVVAERNPSATVGLGHAPTSRMFAGLSSIERNRALHNARAQIATDRAAELRFIYTWDDTKDWNERVTAMDAAIKKANKANAALDRAWVKAGGIIAKRNPATRQIDVVTNAKKAQLILAKAMRQSIAKPGDQKTIKALAQAQRDFNGSQRALADFVRAGSTAQALALAGGRRRPSTGTGLIANPAKPVQNPNRQVDHVVLPHLRDQVRRAAATGKIWQHEARKILSDLASPYSAHQIEGLAAAKRAIRNPCKPSTADKAAFAKLFKAKMGRASSPAAQDDLENLRAAFLAGHVTLAQISSRNRTRKGRV